ncbi:MAG: hypothetical protein ABWZ80_07070, partial [Beijerinckiaceae bacterium]
MSQSSRSVDPAHGAAELLRRFGMAALGVGLPCLAFYSRRAAIILACLGAILLFMGTVIDPAEPIARRVRLFVQSPRFLIAAGLVAWCGATVAWAPFRTPAAERFVNILGVAGLAAAGLAAVPERMRAPALYPLPIGAFASVLTACAVALELRGVSNLNLFSDGAFAMRGVATMTLFAPVSLGWLLSRGRAAEALALAIGLLSATFVVGDDVALIVLSVTLVVFALARAAPRLLIPSFAVIAAALILCAPVLPVLMRPAAIALDLPATAALLGDFSRSVVAEADRLLTGHGLESTPRAMAAGILPNMAGPPLMVSIWYDLGLPAALALAALALARGFGGPERSIDVVAAELGLIFATLAQSFLGVAALQAWW